MTAHGRSLEKTLNDKNKIPLSTSNFEKNQEYLFVKYIFINVDCKFNHTHA